MIRKLRLHFIAITMGGISLIFILILLVINISVTISSRNQGYAFLERTADFPAPKKNSPHQMGGFDALRTFFVFYDNTGSVSQISYTENSEIAEADIIALAEEVLPKNQERGVLSKYLYMIRKNESGTQIFFLDYTREKEMSLNLFWNCLYIGLAGILIIFILVFFLSRWVVMPVKDTFERQKQFIADASHELKTPLTIITTNAEVLSSSLGENKWLKHILSQAERMNTLIRSLLELAKLDAPSPVSCFLRFSLSRTVRNAALSFESLAFEYGKEYTIRVPEEVDFYGNEADIRHLVGILLDNAFKYSDDGGKILIELSSQSEKKILAVENTGRGISKEDQRRIFERFYRSDASRSRESGGYGLGLAIAESIVKSHKGHISIKSDGESYTRFLVVLP